MKPTPPCCPTCGKRTILYAFRGQKQPPESASYRARIKDLIAEFQLDGYKTREEDISVACAVAQIMAVEGEQPHLQRILAHHAERVIASGFLGVSNE